MAGARETDDDGIVSGINVTPLVDITLVLLIIFIVTASSLLKTSIPMELPKAASAEETPAGLLTIGIASGGALFVNGREATLEDLPVAVSEARARLPRPEAPLSAFVSADIAAPYGRFAEVVDRLRVAGVTDVAMDTAPVALTEAMP